MEPSLRGLKPIKLNTFAYIFKNWRVCFTLFDKLALILLSLLIVLSSWQWVSAASKFGNSTAISGGTFIEGTIVSSVDDLDLGRLTKSSLVRMDENQQIKPDLAQSWEVNQDKTSYTFTLVDKITASEIIDQFKKNPTYLLNATLEQADQKKIVFKLEKSSANFLESLTKPIFPYGPYRVDKKTKNEIRLKRNKEYPLERPLIDKFIIRIYPDKNALQKAAKKNAITGAMNLDEVPQKWQQEKLTLSKKHILFINSSRPYLKSLKVREQLLNGQKPDSIKTLDLMEVNGVSADKEFEDFKNKLKSSGIDLKVRQVGLKDALLEDLPKRNYDILYILVNEDLSRDPYLLWHSGERSGDGQNFAEIANADLDQLTEEFRATEDQNKRNEILAKINEEVQKEKVAVEYKNIEANYVVSPKVRGLAVPSICFSETDRFDLADTWHFFERRK